MTVGFALDYIEKRMLAMGHGDNYVLKFRHLVLQPNEERAFSAFNEYYLLVEDHPWVRITSDFGWYDCQTRLIDELQYEHFGKIRVINPTAKMIHVKFIQVLINLPVPEPLTEEKAPLTVELDTDDNEEMNLELDT
ncbi:MAG: hypothetical protein AAF597_14075 [Bacteroidota bacterium]